jgi:hypothetical protein
MTVGFTSIRGKLATSITLRSSRARTQRKDRCRKTTRKAWPLSMRFWSEPHWPLAGPASAKAIAALGRRSE